MLVALPPQSVHRPSQSLSNVFILWQFGVAGRSVSSKALDEEGHCDDKAYAHEEDAIPIGRNPLSNGKEGVLVEQKVLQSHQGTLCIDLSALEKDIAVALEVITGRPSPQAQTLCQVSICRLSTLCPIGGATTASIPARLLARQLTQVSRVVSDILIL